MYLKEIESFKNRIISEISIDERCASYVDFPENISDELKEFLIKRGFTKLYSHQREMFEHSKQGENVIITTQTASGKTLSFLLPVIDEILKDNKTRAIFVYPTKALANDQFRNILPFIEHFGEDRIQAGIYDGDTPPNERTRIRKTANIILTNPEMLNSAFLPNHSLYGFNHVFSKLKFFVVDELHVYRGAFGSHMANIIRRLKRVCKYYRSNPQYLFSSATIANPKELAETLTAEEFYHVKKDGSPSHKKHIYIWQPPYVRDSEYRKTPEEEAAEIIPDMIQNGRRFITFCKSRREVEVVLKETRDKLANVEDIPSLLDLTDKIAGYRGGYKKEERKDIEKRLVKGEINGVIATNALELGIDIGDIDIVICSGFPGTKASFWQQVGRAGRRKEAVGILILDVGPIDQYIAVNSEFLLKTGVENAVLDKNNLFIQLAHVRAAAAELPLTLDDAELFPDIAEIIPVLLKAGELKNDGGIFTWIGKEHPAGDFSLRNISRDIYKVINKVNGEMLTEMDEYQAFHEVYEKAIYMHDGVQYMVEKLDLVNRIATVFPIEVNYFTVPFTDTMVNIIKEFKNINFARTTATFGDVLIKEAVVAYKMIQFHNRQNLGFESIKDNLFTTLETEGLWYLIPNDVDDVLNLYTEFNYYNGIKHSLLTAARIRTMATAEDIGATMFNTVEKDGEIKRAYVILYDLYPGGLGFTEKAFDFAKEILVDAINLVRNCKCKDGCPACVGDYHLDKKMVLWALEGMMKQVEESPKITKKVEEVVVEESKYFKLEELQFKWNDFRNFLKSRSESFLGFFNIVDEVEVRGNVLILNVTSDFFRQWIMDTLNKAKIENIIKRYVEVRDNFSIDVNVIKSESKIDKIIRRYDDLVR
ncbi:MAG: putative ATP-dependent helicase YprA [Caloramator sp.]|nr:MAG: putative ATP-dependent helicase YprA [Caloramator sp.]